MLQALFVYIDLTDKYYCYKNVSYSYLIDLEG